MNRKWLFIGGGVVLLIAIYFIFFGQEDESTKAIKVKVERGSFENTVTTSGELLAKNSEDIEGPTSIRSIGVWQVKIQDLVPEGTIVEEGDYIATLDRTEVTSKLKDVESELQKYESQYTQTQLDTTLELRQAREELINLKYALEERDLALKNSKYEPPATIRQAEIDLDKAKRAYDQAVANYSVKEAQSKAKMQETAATLDLQKNKRTQILDILQEFVIKAPKPGMVIYVREWNGRKKTVGATISAWDPAVATLPDLSVMESQTYVNEIDIGKIHVDQSVSIGVDALPGKSFEGVVTDVANVGEQRPGSSAKVFEVMVEVTKKDSTLRPAMTTSNRILIDQIEDTIFIPLESLRGNDSMTFVYQERGFGLIRKEVISGISNETHAVIVAGLQEGEEIYLSTPENEDEAEVISLDPALKEKVQERLKQHEKELAERKQKAQKKHRKKNANQVSSFNIPDTDTTSTDSVKVDSSSTTGNL